MSGSLQRSPEFWGGLGISGELRGTPWLSLSLSLFLFLSLFGLGLHGCWTAGIMFGKLSFLPRYSLGNP